MDNSEKIQMVRQYISGFIQGPNADALIGTIADEAGRLQDLSISVTDQLTISTASAQYLDKRLSDKGITRPPDLGISDFAFRKLGIEITAQKQLSELIHTILETLYGESAVRANITNTKPEPYELEDGQSLLISLEDGETIDIVLDRDDFLNINAATASEVADVITRRLRSLGLYGFALPTVDVSTQKKYVKIFGGAKGPYSTVSVLGGEANTRLLFPNVRGTKLALNDTAWQVTRTAGSTLRFRWIGNSKPALGQVFPGDKVLLYGSAFTNAELNGTFTVTNVRPPVLGPALDSGWFEIDNPEFSGLRATAADSLPNANNPPGEIYSIAIIQIDYEDLVFLNPQKALPNRQIRYALAWEPEAALLKIYMPATTNVVSRGELGAARLHNLYKTGDLDGSFGSATVDSNKIEVISDKVLRYPQKGYDNYGSGGTLVVGLNSISIDYVRREQFYTTVYCNEPHGLYSFSNIATISQNDLVVTITTASPHGITINDSVSVSGVVLDSLNDIYSVTSIPNPTTIVALAASSRVASSTGSGITVAVDSFGRKLSTQIVSVTVENMATDDAANPFPSPYVVDLKKAYTLRTESVVSRQKIYAGSNLTTLDVDGILPNEPGLLLLDLNRDNEEGGFRYFGVQIQGAPSSADIATISQNGLVVTITTTTPHGITANDNIVVGGVTPGSLNGIYSVSSVPNPTTIIALDTASQIASSVGSGTVTAVTSNLRSTLLLDPSNDFKFNHDIGADINLISAKNAYQPAQDGTDYPMYVTGVAEGRVYAEDIIRKVTALGINLEIIIIYPSDIGLGNQGGSSDPDAAVTSDKVWVWGI
jgi:hypothetical protein